MDDVTHSRSCALVYLTLSIIVLSIIITEPTDFIDSMDGTNYITASLTKPMGISFEENDDSEMGGIFVTDVTEGGSAMTDGTVRPGDQLVSVGDKKVVGLPFEDALGTVIDNTED